MLYLEGEKVELLKGRYRFVRRKAVLGSNRPSIYKTIRSYT